MNKENNFILYDFVAPEDAINPTKTPKTIIYPKQLQRDIYTKHYFAYGERVKTLYFSHYEQTAQTQFTNPVIREVYTYNRDADDLYIEWIDLEISWMLKSGLWSPDTKKVRKVFSSYKKKLSELKTRRETMIFEVEEQSKEIGLDEAIQVLFTKYFLEIGLYKESGTQTFAERIEDDTELLWLDYPTRIPNETIRRYLAKVFRVGTYKPKKSN